MKRLRSLVLPLSLIGCPSCVLGSSAPAATPRQVEVPFGHEHSVECGHFWHSGRWFHEHGHEHGPGCGHRLTDGRWVDD